MRKKIIAWVLATCLCIGISGCSMLPFGPTSGVGTSSSTNSNENASENSSQSSFEEVIEEGGMSIHFLELGNWYTGDCTFIKVGDVDILIDAGSRYDSAGTIVPYISELCTDGVLEYVIATHAHQDHIAGFVGNSVYPGIFDSFVCETIIDYARTNSTSKVRESYESLRDKEVKNGATHYTALDCWYEVNGAKRSYQLAEGITMNILYQKFYENKASEENNYSVCLLFSEGDNHYLFTGDLEKTGEASLLTNNLPKCKLYKAGHHGSKTSSTDLLLEVIQPEIVCVCCCCGSAEYTSTVANMFPTQDFVNRVAPYTDKVYVTSITSTNAQKFESMNGNIVVSWNGKEMEVNCTNNNIIFKDTEWFQKNRTMPEAWKN
ncbi:MAG: MBL fold metallo-hydrolase [Clostridia bacterium]|nr:MBL fold metallo-hydrolase [Clostridia bacterium]